MKFRPLLCASSLLLCAAGMAHGQATSPAAPAPAMAAPVTMAQALQAARDNVEVAIARSGLAAARADILTADHAPVPVLSAKTASIDLDNGIGPGGLLRKRIDKSIGIDWTWERGNKRALRTRGARQLAEAAQADVDDTIQQQQLAAQGAFFDLLAAQERVQLVQALAQDARQLAATAARRTRAGDLAAQDARRMEIEAARAAADAQSAGLERQRAALALGPLIGRGDAGEHLQASGDWALPAPPAQTDAAALAATRPEVLAAAARVDAAQAALDGARALRKADITWGVSYDHYPGTSRALVELRAQMPLHWGYEFEGEIGRALAELRQAEDTQQKVLRATTTELQRLRLEATTALALAQRQDSEIVPSARAVANTAEQAYQRGGIDLTDLLDARRTLRAALLEALAARQEAAKASGAWLLRSQAGAVYAPHFPKDPS